LASAPEALGRDTLYDVIGAVAQGPELGRVLPAIIDLLTEATACHACFVYLLEGETLLMRAASQVFASSVGRVAISVDEGLCGWVVRNDEPAFIRDRAMDDPRMKVVPELDEERFQSMVAVPLRGRAQSVIGVIVLHTEAPREFGQEVLDFLTHVASLVAGAIENARLFERERERASVLAELAALVQRIATVTDRAELLRMAVDGTRELLRADSCRLFLVTGPDGAQRVVARSGHDDPGSGRSSIGPGRSGGAFDRPPIDAPDRGALAKRLPAEDVGQGVLTVEREAPFERDEAGVLETVAGQLAVALRTVSLIEHLTKENLVRDLFDAIAAGRAGQLAGRARSAHVDPERPHVVAVLEPLTPAASWDGAAAVEERLRRSFPGALCDAGPERLRVLLPVVARGGGPADDLAWLDAQLGDVAVEEGLAAGRSSVQPRLAANPASLTEALGAARIARALAPDGGARAWDALGAYRYLAGVGPELEPDARHGRAVAELWTYDARRGAGLVETLEHYLSDRRIVPTARALFIHPNTLRQRLERVESLGDAARHPGDAVQIPWNSSDTRGMESQRSATADRLATTRVVGRAVALSVAGIAASIGTASGHAAAGVPRAQLQQVEVTDTGNNITPEAGWRVVDVAADRKSIRVQTDDHGCTQTDQGLAEPPGPYSVNISIVRIAQVGTCPPTKGIAAPELITVPLTAPLAGESILGTLRMPPAGASPWWPTWMGAVKAAKGMPAEITGFRMPSLIGLSPNDAAEIATSMAIPAGRLTILGPKPLGAVVRQDPAPGAAIYSQVTHVTLTTAPLGQPSAFGGALSAGESEVAWQLVGVGADHRSLQVRAFETGRCGYPADVRFDLQSASSRAIELRAVYDAPDPAPVSDEPIACPAALVGPQIVTVPIGRPIAGQTITGNGRTAQAFSPSTRPVPSLVGLRIPDAMQVLRSLGIANRQITFHGPHRGRVISQVRRVSKGKVQVVLKTHA
jgi:putative methionine-R-sulfoxide reductase with GAF domain